MRKKIEPIIRLLFILGPLFVTGAHSWGQIYNPVNQKNAQGERIGLWVSAIGDLITEAGFYVNGKLHGPSFQFADSGSIREVSILAMGVKQDIAMDSLYPLEGSPFFHSIEFTGLRYWLDGYWNLKNGYLHGVHVNHKDKRAGRKGKSYYIYYNGHCIYMWFVDKKGRFLNGYNLFEVDDRFRLEKASLERNKLQLVFYNDKIKPVIAPNMGSRTCRYDLKTLNPNYYWTSNDTLYLELVDTVSRNEFIWSTQVGGYKQKKRPYQFFIGNKMIEQLLLPGERRSYSLAVEFTQQVNILVFRYKSSQNIVIIQNY